MEFDVIVIGGGAAGLFCARTAALRGRRVLLLEHNARCGNKILISGGGRCNFTNLGATAANYVTSGSPHFMKSALARYTPQDFLGLVERHGIAWHEKKLGQLFCDQSSKQILQLLEDECADAGVDVRVNCRIASVQRQDLPSPAPATAEGWAIVTSLGSFTAASLVIATGALSFPKLGATPFGYELAKQFGVKLVTPRPGLVPFTWGPAERDRFAELSGLSLDCVASAGPDAPTFRENLLFTHRGLSGPAILQISSHWRAGEAVRLNLLPEVSALDLFAANRSGGREVKTALRTVLPERFVQAWLAQHAPTRPIAQLPQRELETLARSLNAWEIRPAGDEGYPKAEVTVGGVDTGELSSKTMECRAVPGLFFIGEVVDVTGWLGGYNFQWAWASGHAAGQAA
ncbi:MAG TPA: NAD(P)/FAD-dependent oxidoreductase [Candidatus Limnocylindria bacterium]|nr:NAD(P)/FAD-dependent oxidoreductase [Candidatus Limnocylindria bacterium]